jgi:hypothetical protein
LLLLLSAHRTWLHRQGPMLARLTQTDLAMQLAGPSAVALSL